jgi:asparagine synthase (glutamine-hydrolysing)
LVNFCYSLHSNLKIKNGIGKYLLRESMRGKLPENIRNRKDKTGHNAPSGDWWRGEQKN